MDDLSRLAVAASQGDPVALAGFVRRAQIPVWRLCAHLVDRASADDLTQDTLLKAIKSLPTFRAEGSALTWVLAIARRTCADAIRARQRLRRRLQRPDPPRSIEPPATGTVDLDLLIGALNPDRRAAFALTQILGLSYAEAAGVCAVPVGTIRSRVARARDDLLAAIDSQASREA